MTERDAKINAVADCYVSWRECGESPDEAVTTIRELGAEHNIDSAAYLEAEEIGEKIFQQKIMRRVK